MAGYRTHLTFSAIASGVAATGLYITDVCTQSEAIMFLCSGIIGGMLPDLDSKSSIPLRIVFNLSGIIVAFFMVFRLGQRYSIIELFIIWVGSYVIISLLIFTFISRLTVHRGLMHSFPAAALFLLLTVIICKRFFILTSEQSWMIGIFIFLGYLSHLILDDIIHAALKLYDKKHIFNTVLLYIVIGCVFYITPEIGSFEKVYGKPSVYRNITNKLFPEDKWFR
ncbi:MAG: metal-dependent hydrolase [Nitrospirae bacterium]|nr:metal-dependent hydrolase [Nitrospirota bacterium]MBF0542679.1 metal-dependent hydrolase [Nitrospirota bacterium]